MPPKTRRATSNEDTTTENKDSLHNASEPKKQKLDEYETLKNEANKTNHSGDKENEHANTEFTKEYNTRSHDEDHSSEESKPKEPQKHHEKDSTNNVSTETKEDSNQGESKVLEKGKLAFYFRPKVDHETVTDANDIQRFSFAMTPEDKSIHRLIVVGSKKFPEKGSRSRCFAFVEKTSGDLDEINALLQPYDYDTKTKGDRHQEGSRVVGEALYELIQHGPDHVHLAYVLDIPTEPTESQTIFNIGKEGAMLCTVRNPTAGPSASRSQGLQSKQKAQYPPKLMDRFKGKVKSSTRFASLHPEFLNYEGCELLMIATGKDPKSEFKEIMEELENEAEELEEMVDKKTHHHPEESIYKERHLNKEDNPDATSELK